MARPEHTNIAGRIEFFVIFRAYQLNLNVNWQPIINWLLLVIFHVAIVPAQIKGAERRKIGMNFLLVSRLMGK